MAIAIKYGIIKKSIIVLLVIVITSSFIISYGITHKK